MKALLRVLALWRPQAGWLLFGVLVSLAAIASAVLLMTLSGSLLAVSLMGGVALIPMLLRVVGPARVVLRYAERLATHAATFRALAALRVWFFRGLAARSAGGLGFRRSGDLLSRLVNDVEALDGLYLRIIVPVCGAVLLTPVLALWLGRREGQVAIWVTLLFAAAAFLFPILAGWVSLRAGERLASAGSALRVATLDAVTGLREIQAYGAGPRIVAGLGDRQAELIAEQARLGHWAALFGAAAFLAGQAALLLLLAHAGRHPVFSVAAVFLTVAAFELVGGLPRAGVLAGHAAAAARRVLTVAEGPLPIADPARPAPMPDGNGLHFEQVRFRWAPDRPMVFDGLTLAIRQGARVALLGPSGIGKSSLAALALKVMVPEGGRVLLDGVDLAHLSAAEVRSRIGWLGQATHLFNDTIRANLLLGRPDASEADLWAALDQAAIGETIRTLPDGLESWVGEGGTRFSGGQGRRLALARVLLSRAPILILDEPCAGLDTETERAFLETLNGLAADRTMILIAHRLTGVERLDRVYRLSGGHAVAAMA